MIVQTFLGVIDGSIVEMYRTEKVIRERKRVHLYFVNVKGRMQRFEKEDFEEALDNFNDQVK